MSSHFRGLALPATLALAFCAPAQAHDYKVGSLTIAHPWVRATPGGAKVGAGYLTITNTGDKPDRLVGGAVSGAARVEIHVTSNAGGIRKPGSVSSFCQRTKIFCPRRTSSVGPGNWPA